MSILSWPIQMAIVEMSTSDCSIRSAVVCRKVWGVIFFFRVKERLRKLFCKQTASFIAVVITNVIGKIFYGVFPQGNSSLFAAFFVYQDVSSGVFVLAVDVDVSQLKLFQHTYDINSILEVEVTVVSNEEKQRKIFNSRNIDKTENEIAERINELSYLKIRPREQEQNKMCLLKVERLYEESTGSIRIQIENALRKFETHLDTQDPVTISNGRKEMLKLLDTFD